MKRLLLFETAAQLEKLVAKFDTHHPENTWIALTPEADYAAEKLEIEYKTIEDFYSDLQLMELGIQNFARVGEFCAELDRHLHQALKDIPEAEAISTHDDFYDFKLLFDGLLHRTFSLVGLINSISPDLIVYFDYSSAETSIKTDIEHNRLVSKILPLVAKNSGVKTAILSPHKIAKYAAISSNLIKTLKHVLVSQLLEVPGGQILAGRLIGFRKKLLPNTASLDNESITLIGDVNSPFDAGRVIRKWVDSSLGNPLTPGQIIKTGENTNEMKIRHLYVTAKAACANAWAKINGDTIRAFFGIKGIDLYPLVKAYLKDYICSALPQRIITARKLKFCLRQIKQGVIITDYVPGWVAAIAGQADIPTVAFQHGGGHGYLDWPIAEHLLLGTDYFFCYGSGVSAFFGRPSPNAHLSLDAQRPLPVPIGSPSLDILKQQEQISKPKNPKNEKGRTVVYVLTNLGGDTRYFSYHMYPDIWFWRLQRKVIETCTKYQNIQLLIKLYPKKGIRKDLTHNPVRDWLSDASLPQYEVVEDVPFTDLLSIGDLFIIDLPATTLLEALTTTKPIITFADPGWVKLQPEAMNLLRKRAMVSDSGEQFITDIEKFLEAPKWELPEPINDEFLKAYGTHLDDGQSAERAVQVLVRLASSTHTSNSFDPRKDESSL